MGKPAARVGDAHVCPMFDGPKPHVGGPVLPPGKPTVWIGGMPAATILDRCFCASLPDVIIKGSSSVLINGLPAARMGDATLHGGRITSGCPTVLIGDFGMGGFGVGAIGVLNTSWQQLANTNLSIDERSRLIDSIGQYKRTEHVLAMARLSQHVYGGKTPLPDGYETVSQEELLRMGITPSMLTDDSSGFKAAVYKKKNTQPGQPAYVVAYAGTEDVQKDGVTDALQGIGVETTQYNKAMDLAVAMSIATDDSGGFETTGHSLGGGLAAAGSAVTGAPGTTFNAAGLHQKTTERRGVGPEERERNSANVDAYYNTDDPLSLAQNNRGKIIAGSSYFIGVPAAIVTYSSGAMPSAYGNQQAIPSDTGILKGHQIGTVISNLEKQQETNRAILVGNP